MTQTIKLFLVMMCGFAFGASVAFSSNGVQGGDEKAHPALQDVISIIQTFYVDRQSTSDLEKAAIQGVLASLDPYSKYLDAEDIEAFRSNTQGAYFGYGIEVGFQQGVLTIVSPMPNSPAAFAGIESGDVITHIDGIKVTSENTNDLLMKIKRLSNDKAQLKLSLTSNAQLKEVSLTPQIIEVDSAVWELLSPQMAYIKINTFSEKTVPQVKQALTTLDPATSSLVFDLRDNPGGLFDQAIKVADMFLSEGVIVSTQGRFWNANQIYKATPSQYLANTKIVVLINKGSASAAEVLAAALQDNNRATVMGQTSFGKGLVQSLIPMDETGSMIKITTAKYFTPAGNDINQKGIEPDIFVDPKTELVGAPMPALPENKLKDIVLIKAIQTLQQSSSEVAVVD